LQKADIGPGKRQGAITMFRSIIHVIPRSVRTLLAPRYRPERHYMRGPGPAWRAKHGSH